MWRSPASLGLRHETGLGVAGNVVREVGRGRLTEGLAGQNKLNIYSVKYGKLITEELFSLIWAGDVVDPKATNPTLAQFMAWPGQKDSLGQPEALPGWVSQDRLGYGVVTSIPKSRQLDTTSTYSLLMQTPSWVWGLSRAAATTRG